METVLIGFTVEKLHSLPTFQLHCFQKEKDSVFYLVSGKVYRWHFMFTEIFFRNLKVDGKIYGKKYQRARATVKLWWETHDLWLFLEKFFIKNSRRHLPISLRAHIFFKWSSLVLSKISHPKGLLQILTNLLSLLLFFGFPHFPLSSFFRPDYKASNARK